MEPTKSWTIKNAEDLGNVVKQARRRERLTQRQLALSVGTGERFIVDLENGKNTAHLGKALEVASALGLKITATYED
jgi:y4mF family transcriptional regulator